MLQTVQKSEDFDDLTIQAARQVEVEMAGTHDRLFLGRGLFRGFLDFRLAPDSPISQACSTNAFITASSNLLR